MNAFYSFSLCEPDFAPGARTGAFPLLGLDDLVCHRPEPVLPPTDDDDEDEEDDRGSSGGNIDPDEDEGDFDDDDDDDDDETLWTSASPVPLSDGYR